VPQRIALVPQPIETGPGRIALTPPVNVLGC
jgi:hypothetical protein